MQIKESTRIFRFYNVIGMDSKYPLMGLLKTKHLKFNKPGTTLSLCKAFIQDDIMQVLQKEKNKKLIKTPRIGVACLKRYDLTRIGTLIEHMQEYLGIKGKVVFTIYPKSMKLKDGYDSTIPKNLIFFTISVPKTWWKSTILISLLTLIIRSGYIYNKKSFNLLDTVKLMQNSQRIKFRDKLYWEQSIKSIKIIHKLKHNNKELFGNIKDAYVNFSTESWLISIHSSGIGNFHELWNEKSYTRRRNTNLIYYQQRKEEK